MDTVSLIGAASARRPADLILTNAYIAVLHTGELIDGEVAIVEDRIVGVGALDERLRGASTELVDVGGGVIAPGLFDPHFHVGGSHLSMTELARALLPLGTTSIATDCQEAYTYAGPAGVRAFIDEARAAGLRAFLIPSVHVLGLETVGTFRWAVSGADMAEMVSWPEAVGINEPPPAPVLGGHPGVIEAIEATKRLGKKLPGHAPGIHGANLQAYVAAGFDACHESTTSDQALEKLRLGMQVMARQGSASPDLAALLPLLASHPTAARFTMLCSDEEDPRDLVAHGHLDEKLRMCAGAGIEPLTALAMASLNATSYFRLDHLLGSVTPGKLADLVVFEDLARFRVRLVLSAGRVVARDGVMVSPRPAATVPSILRSRVDVPRPFEPDDFRVKAAGSSVDVRVIAVEDGSLVSRDVVRTARVVGGSAVADPASDLLKLAVIDRHSDEIRLATGFVSGFGLREGAVATTYCHVHYDLLSLGTSDEELAHAANVVREMGGGMAVVRDGEVIARWELPIVGIFTTQPLAEARDAFVGIGEAIRSLGCELKAPVLALSFVALPTIPALGLTDRGLIDVATQAFVDVVVPAA